MPPGLQSEVLEGSVGMSRLAWLGMILMTLGVNAMPVWGDDAHDAFQTRVFEHQGNSLSYRILFHLGFQRNKKYPLVVFLHGAGERGTDNSAQLVHGMNDFARSENRAKYPCFVIAPQCPQERRWVEVDWGAAQHRMPEKPSIPLTATIALLDSLQQELPVDVDRLYVTGLSMGGYGAWDLAQRFPSRFAAIAPICGGGDELQAPRLKSLPIWAFHGDQDTAVKPERSRNMIAAIKSAGGQPKYTEYPGVGHNSWSQTYADPLFFEWLFAQQRGSKP